MSAQKISPKGFFTAIVGMLGFSAVAGLLVAVMVTPAIAVTGMTATSTIGIFDGLPEFIEIGAQPQQNEIFAQTGVNEDGTPSYMSVAVVFNQNREEAEWDNVSQYLKDATVAGEDRRFYQHGGVDIAGVMRAAIGNITGGDLSGASTLSMQLVKNIYIQQALQAPTEELQKKGIKDAQKTSIDRKLKEMKLAIGLEKTYTKDEILLAYLNIAGFGGNTYGIEAAARQYYGVSAADVTIAQAASLIAIVQEPGARSLSSPDNYDANKDRRNTILYWMLTEKMITQAEHDEAKATPVDETTVSINPPRSGCIAAYAYATQFCDYVVKNVKNFTSLGADEQERKDNWKIGGYKLYTSLDLRLQTVAQDTVTARAPIDEPRLELGSASTSVEVGTGRILTMAQNKVFNDSLAGGGIGATAVNFNTDKAYGGSSGFQVGSTYKTFTLINWLESGHGLNEVVDASPRTEEQAKFADSCNGPHAGVWKFKNSSGESGTRTVLRATVGSVNGAYASMGMQLDQCLTMKAAMRLGVHPAGDDPYTPEAEASLNSFPSAILGTNTIAPLTMAAAYAGIAAGGLYCKPTAVDYIVTAAGETLPGQAKDCAVVLDPEVAATTAYALQQAYASYAANTRDGIPMMAKTGTTDKANQTWIVGSSTRVATAVWFGNIKGDFSITRYPGGYGNRHGIGKVIFGAANNIYGGGSFPEPAARLLTGAGVEVPSLNGGTLENAKALLEGLGLTFADGGQVNSDLPAGTVVSSDPGSSAIIARGMTVTVFTSNGSMSTVPDVVSGNNDYATASSALNAAGFTNVGPPTCAVVLPLSPQIGKVVSSDPAAGSVWVRTAEVKLAVGQEICL
ncbi:MAG: transglycosylase domain-containing protein [Microbacteriaceae bacterium]